MINSLTNALFKIQLKMSFLRIWLVIQHRHFTEGVLDDTTLQFANLARVPSEKITLVVRSTVRFLPLIF